MKRRNRSVAGLAMALSAAILFCGCASSGSTGGLKNRTDAGISSNAEESDAGISSNAEESGAGTSSAQKKTGNGGLLSDTEPVSDTGFYFDTVITVTLYGQSQKDHIDGCFALAEKYENLLSNTIKTSDISRINDADGAFVEVSDETVEVLKEGLSFCKTSGGVFDITIGGVSGLWDFTGEKDTVPEKDRISEALKHVAYQKLEIDGNRVALKDPEAVLDLGGIAKGFIADKMKEYLLSEGVGSGIINLGGNVLVIGSKPDDSSYVVGIEKPFETNQVLGKLTLKDKSVVTSGIYQRYFEKDGTIYHHILDPETGFPIENGLYSVTIISDRSVDGDGLSTTCFLLGPEKGMELIEQTEGVEAIFADENLSLRCSSGIGSKVEFEPE